MTRFASRLAAVVLSCLLAGASLAQTADSATLTLPAPDVEGLDAAAAEQVTALQQAVTATLDDAQASAQERAEAAGEMGRLYNALGRLGSAETCYRVARRLSPQDYRWPYYLGVLLEGDQRLEEAAAAYEAALAERQDLAALTRLSRVYTALGRPEAAERNAQQALRLDPDVAGGAFDDPLIDGLVDRADERVHLLLGRRAFRDGDFETAASEFEQAVAISPESATGLLNLGLTLSALGLGEEAVSRFERAVEVAPDDVAPRLELGIQLAAQGELGAARTRLEEAIALDPDNSTAHTELAAVLWHAGDAPAALEGYRQAIALDPTAERPRLGEAQVLESMGRYGEVRQRLEETRALLPNSGLVAYALAWVLATSPDSETRDGARALELAQGVFNSRGRIEDAVLVAAALGALDRCSEAAELLRGMADAAAKTPGAAEVAAYLQPRVEHFEQGAPCLLPPVGGFD
jgi:tetratricopeptide (TPR) repeat protein